MKECLDCKGRVEQDEEWDWLDFIAFVCVQCGASFAEPTRSP